MTSVTEPLMTPEHKASEADRQSSNLKLDSLEQRTERLEKDMQWVREALTHLLLAQYGEETPMGNLSFNAALIETAGGFHFN